MTVPEWYILLSMGWVAISVISCEWNVQSIEFYRNDDVRIWSWCLLLLLGLEIINNFKLELDGFWLQMEYIHFTVLKLGLYVFLFICAIFKPHVLLCLIVPFVFIVKNAEYINNWLISLTNGNIKKTKVSMSTYLFWHGFFIGVAGIILSSAPFILMTPYWKDFLPNIIMDCLIAPFLLGGYGLVLGIIVKKIRGQI